MNVASADQGSIAGERVRSEGRRKGSSERFRPDQNAHFANESGRRKGLGIHATDHLSVALRPGVRTPVGPGFHVFVQFFQPHRRRIKKP
jgi:hypothetical protein